MAGKKAKADNIILEITSTRHGFVEKDILLIDRQTRFNLIADPLSARVQDGPDLVSSLMARGAVWNDVKGKDGNITPALQRFNEATGNRTYLCHYREGNRQDPAKGVLAEQFFNAVTGKRGTQCSYDEHTEYGSARRRAETAPANEKTPALPERLAAYVVKGVKPVL